MDYIIPGNDDAMRAVGLYAAAIADAVLEGMASGPEMPAGEDEFVELDEEGKPKPKPAGARRPGPDRGRRPGGRRVEASIAPEPGEEVAGADGTRPRPAPVGRRPGGGGGAPGGRGRPGGGAGGGRGRPGGGAGGGAGR